MGSKAKEGVESIRYSPRGSTFKKTLYDTGYMGEGKYSSYNSPLAHESWRGIFRRVYCLKSLFKYPTYIGCSVHEDWHNFQNFAKWFEENYVKGWKIDKDILIKGNKIYSPDTCCFVPHEINMKFIVPPLNKHGLPRGIQPINGKYLVEVRSIDQKRIYSRFLTIGESQKFWQSHRVNIIRELAEKFKNELNIKVYNKLISIT